MAPKTKLPTLPPERPNEPKRLQLAREIHWILYENPNMTYVEIAKALNYSTEYIANVARNPEDRREPTGICGNCGCETSWNTTTRTAHRFCKTCANKNRTTQFCGTVRSYERGCKCKKCKAANAAKGKAYRKRKAAKLINQQS